MKSLSERDVKIDWKKFGSIDMNQFSREIPLNESLVHEFGTYIAFCSTDGEFDTQLIDQNFVKLFKMSQIIIKYLMNELNRLKSSENEFKTQHNLIQENKKLRKLLEIHQKAMAYSGTAYGDSIQCPHCPKVFYDSTYLKTHIARRHPKESLDSKGMLSLTNKIGKYQSVLIGDNKSIEEMRTQIQVLNEKLGKTDLDLLLEKESRMKSEERIQYDVELKVHEIQQSLREEIEEFKFTQRENVFENDLHSSSENIHYNSGNTHIEDGEQTIKSNEVNKIEEMIAIQAKEMVKLGNNVQKLVTHLTDSLPLSTRNNQKLNSVSTEIKTLLKHENQSNDKLIEVQNKVKAKESEKVDEITNKNINRNLIERNEEHSQPFYGNKKSSLKKSVFNEMNEKLFSFGVEFNAKGITEDQYKNALKKVKSERKLLIEQNRHDYDFVSTEKSIRKLIDEKVFDIINKKSDNIKSIEPKVKEQKIFSTVSPIKKDEIFENQNSKAKETQYIEAIVHNTSVTQSLTTSDQNEDIDPENKQQFQKDKTQVSETLTVRPKSALASSLLKSGLNEKYIENEDKLKPKQQKRIRFSEHRIEHQISPEESSEDTSDELSPIDFNNKSFFELNRNDMTSSAPIPAQRNNKNISSQISNTKLVKELNENKDESYESDDYLIDKVLNSMNDDLSESQTIKGIDQSLGHSNQTKVQELAQIIEKQLTERSASNKKPPIGSVNVMSTAEKQKSSKSLLERLNSDSDDEYN